MVWQGIASISMAAIGGRSRLRGLALKCRGLMIRAGRSSSFAEAPLGHAAEAVERNSLERD